MKTGTRREFNTWLLSQPDSEQFNRLNGFKSAIARYLQYMNDTTIYVGEDYFRVVSFVGKATLPAWLKKIQTTIDRTNQIIHTAKELKDILGIKPANKNDPL